MRALLAFADAAGRQAILARARESTAFDRRFNYFITHYISRYHEVELFMTADR